ncbi:MAG: cytochrome P450 [Gammaproteobacteria bacterium]|jgi:cytochrome P450
MTAIDRPTAMLPQGPREPVDINADQQSFIKIGELIDQYGDICAVQSSRNKISYIVNQADYLKHILIRNSDNYKKGPGFELVKLLLGNGIIVSDGAFWRRQRRMIQPAFNKKFIGTLYQHIADCNRRLYQQWQHKAAHHQVIDITQNAAELSLDVVLALLFSDDVSRMYDEQGNNPFAFLTHDLTRDLKVVLKFRTMIKHIRQLIAWRREAQPQRTDFLAMFMAATDKETGEAMTDKELINELTTLIIAGHETSAITLNWSWYFIANHPHIEQQLLDEIGSVADNEIPEYDSLGRLTGVRHVVEEALRLYPPVWLFSRTAINDDKLGDYEVPAGAHIFISPYYLHRHHAYWPDAERFDPQRFTERAVQTRHKTAYLPFSAGPRRCIGDFLAIVEMQAHFGLMLPEFRLEYLDERPIELEAGINLRSKHPLRFRISRR